MAAIILTGRQGILLALDFRILLPGLYLAGTLLAAAAVIAVVRRVWRSDEEDRSSRPGDQLAHYRTLYEQGLISEEEFKSLRGILGGELRRSIDLPAKPSVAGDKPAEASPTAAQKPPEGENNPPTNGVCPA